MCSHGMLRVLQFLAWFFWWQLCFAVSCSGHVSLFCAGDAEGGEEENDSDVDDPSVGIPEFGTMDTEMDLPHHQGDDEHPAGAGAAAGAVEIENAAEASLSPTTMDHANANAPEPTEPAPPTTERATSSRRPTIRRLDRHPKSFEFGLFSIRYRDDRSALYPERIPSWVVQCPVHSTADEVCSKTIQINQPTEDMSLRRLMLWCLHAKLYKSKQVSWQSWLVVEGGGQCLPKQDQANQASITFLQPSWSLVSKLATSRTSVTLRILPVSLQPCKERCARRHMPSANESVPSRESLLAKAPIATVDLPEHLDDLA